MIIPTWVIDFDSYRRWAHSVQLPKRTQVAFLDGAIWVDTNGEDLFTHADVRTAFGVAIHNGQSGNEKGAFVAAGMFYTNRQANLAIEPDGMYYLWSTMKSGRLQLTEKVGNDFMELTGSADIVLEVLSYTSAQRDDGLLRDLYWKAGFTEYWLADARTDPLRFDILQRTENGFVTSPPIGGWLRSNVLYREFRLVRRTDPLGDPQFVVEVR